MARVVGAVLVGLALFAIDQAVNLKQLLTSQHCSNLQGSSDAYIHKQLGSENPWRIGSGRHRGSSKRIR